VLSQFDGTGLRGLVAAHPEAVLELPVSAATVLEDMDTPAEYARQRERFTRGVRLAWRRPDGQ
jgi:CTP:molybdopterin cytidylyltransferase MocA